MAGSIYRCHSRPETRRRGHKLAQTGLEPLPPWLMIKSVIKPALNRSHLWGSSEVVIRTDQICIKTHRGPPLPRTFDDEYHHLILQTLLFFSVVEATPCQNAMEDDCSLPVSNYQHDVKIYISSIYKYQGALVCRLDDADFNG